MKAHSKTEEKKRQILLKALNCFVENGVDKTSIQMICDATQTSVGSLYHHFGNKEAIAAAVYIEGMRDFSSMVDEYLRGLTNNNSAEILIKTMVYANVDWITNNKKWASYVFKNRSVLDNEYESTLQQGTDDFHSRFKPLIQKYVDDNSIKKLRIAIYTSFISGPVHTYARHYLAGRYKKQLKAYREEFAQGAWDAIKN